MKRPTLILIIILAALLASACNSSAEPPDDVGSMEGAYISDPESDGNNNSTESAEESDDAITNCDEELSFYGDPFVHDLLSKRLGEVLDLLGSDHSEPFFYLGAPSIVYKHSFVISFANYDRDLQVLEIQPEAHVVAVGVLKELDIYKGISVGKTLDEINSNPDLLRPLKPRVDEMDGVIRAVGIYLYKESQILMHVTFSEEMVCSNVFIKIDAYPTDLDMEWML